MGTRTHKLSNGEVVTITSHATGQPTPMRGWDWMATTGDYEGGDPVGLGPTEEAAVLDLIGMLEDE